MQSRFYITSKPSNFQVTHLSCYWCNGVYKGSEKISLHQQQLRWDHLKFRFPSVIKSWGFMRLAESYLSKVFFFPVLDKFLPPNQTFAVSVACLLRLQKLPINLIFTFYKSHIWIFIDIFGSVHRELELCLCRFTPKPAASKKILRIQHALNDVEAWSNFVVEFSFRDLIVLTRREF